MGRIKYLAFLGVLIICVFMITHRFWFSPDQFFIVALIGSFLIGRARLFLFDWVPFIASYFAYEFTRGIVPHLKNIHILGMIKLDSFFFGFIPAAKFQSLFYNPNQVHWYDYLSALLYISHFVTPMIAGFLFWLTDRKIFKQYALAFIVLSYAGLVTFILFPAMPPWMASDMGYITTKIPQTLGPIMSHFPVLHASFPTLYSLIDADPVAAIPSLHAAFPLLILLFLIKKYKKYGLLFVPYVAGVWFSVMYLGEHYFTDILIGSIYAIVVFLIVDNWKFLHSSFTIMLANLKKTLNIA